MPEDKIIDGGGSLSDFLSKLQERFDNNTVHPDNLMTSKEINNDPKNITNDQGQIVDRDTWDWKNKGNPFQKMIDGAGKGSVFGLLKDLGVLEGSNPTDVGSATKYLQPGADQPTSDVTNPTPMKDQQQAGMRPLVPLPQPRPDYSQPTALDPTQIEDLRKSLLTEAGQYDPSNPNGLSGRMNSPNSAVDQRSQMDQTQQQHDTLRGFDGSRAARLKKGQI